MNQGHQAGSSEGLLRESVFLMLGFLAVVLITDPRGNFPLNDDWNFALSTWHFADTGEFRFSRLTAMSLRAQVLWGALWTAALGRSFEVLRASTLVLSAGTILLLQRLLAFLGIGRWVRVIVCAAFLFQPLFFWSSFTFMTHVPYVFLSILAFYLFLRGVVEDRIGFTVLASLAVTGSFFIRQTGIVNGVVALMVLFSLRRNVRPERMRGHMIVAAMPVLVFVSLYAGTSLLEGYSGQIREHLTMWDARGLELATKVFGVVMRDVVMNFQYAALLMLPLVVAFLVLPRTKAGVLLLLVLLLPFLWVSTTLWSLGSPMPYRVKGEVLINLGLGPPTLRDTWNEGLPYPFHLPAFATTALTLASAVGGAWLLWGVTQYRVRESGELRTHAGARSMAGRYSLLHMALATAALFVSGLYFDRYVLDSLWALSVFIPIVAENRIVRVRPISVILVVLFAIFSVGTTQEYLDWNRARWRALGDLQSRGITLDRIDGGYEINQYLIGGFDGPLRLRRPGFSVIDDEFVLAFQPLPGFREISCYPFKGFFGLRQGNVRVLERKIAQ